MSFLMTSRCFSSSVSYYLYFYLSVFSILSLFKLSIYVHSKKTIRYSHLIHVQMNTVEVRVKIYVKTHQIARTWVASRGLFFDLIMILF